MSTPLLSSPPPWRIVLRPGTPVDTLFIMAGVRRVIAHATADIHAQVRIDFRHVVMCVNAHDALLQASRSADPALASAALSDLNNRDSYPVGWFMASRRAATRAPWRIELRKRATGNVYFIKAAEGVVVMYRHVSRGDRTRQNFERIVECVNAHHELLTAAQALATQREVTDGA